MKTELRLSPHSIVPGAQVVELWYDGKFVGQVTGADGPGVRVISKFVKTTGTAPMVLEVRLDTSREED